MEETGNPKRLLLAVALSVAVLLGWQYLFPPPKPAPKAKTPIAGTETSSAAEHPTIGLTTGSTAAVARRREVQPEIFEFEGAVTNEKGEKLPYKLELTNVGGAAESFELSSYFERDKSNKKTDKPIKLAEHVANTDENLKKQMFGLSFAEGSTARLPARPIYEVVEKTENSIRYRFVTDDNTEIEREYRLNKESFNVEFAVTIRNRSEREQRHALQIRTALQKTAAMEGGFLFVPPPDHLNAVCYTEGKVQREASDHQEFSKNVEWIGIDRQYFLGAVAQRDKRNARCTVQAENQLLTSIMTMPETTLRPGEESRYNFTGYLGVKNPTLLTQAEAKFESAIDYVVLGLNLAVVCEALLAIMTLIHNLSGSWGIAILGLTVLVKLILFPLNQRSGKSMRALASLKPEIDLLKEKFPNDRQRQSEEMMKLYRKHGVNPAGGCVPILIQMPIWFALYRALWVSVDLYQSSFLWLPDLTARDPYWILPVALVVVMFIQQKMTPNTMDPAQQKVMLYMMPLLFGSMMAALPAGLAFYILVNSLLTIAQQHLINRTVRPKGGSTSEQPAPA